MTDERKWLLALSLLSPEERDACRMDILLYGSSFIDLKTRKRVPFTEIRDEDEKDWE